MQVDLTGARRRERDDRQADWMTMKERLRQLLARFVSVVTSRRFLRGVEFTVVVLLGAWLGLLVGGQVKADVGPVVTEMSLRPALWGDTVVKVSPLGSLTLDSHDGPLQLRVDVSRLNLQDARAIFTDPNNLRHLEAQVVDDVWAGVVRLGIQSLAAAVIGAAALSFLVFRRWRPTGLAGAVSLAVLLSGVACTGATWNSRSVLEPRYSGLLASAPSLVGNAQSIVSSFDQYSKELAKLVTNVSKLYDVTSSLPSFQADPSTIRVLHVSDIHLNPSSWEVMRSIAQQFEISLVIDSGDLTDHGSRPEDRFVAGIASLGVPYVFARGNHDSAGTERAVAAQPRVTVLRGQTVTVEGLRITGDADPRFTPDRSVSVPGEDAVRAMGERLAERAWEALEPPDLAVVHDPTAAEPLDDAVPLVLAGHTHRRSTRLLEEGTRLFIQGSTGGAGLRALEGAEPTPIECSVLYFDRATRRLQAWDDITLGGLGLASAEINRHVPSEKELGRENDGGNGPGNGDGSPSPTPSAPSTTPPVPPSPAGSTP
jgi:predicted MPP superfamily phosphohydrolase